MSSGMPTNTFFFKCKPSIKRFAIPTRDSRVAQQFFLYLFFGIFHFLALQLQSAEGLVPIQFKQSNLLLCNIKGRALNFAICLDPHRSKNIFCLKKPINLTSTKCLFQPTPLSRPLKGHIIHVILYTLYPIHIHLHLRGYTFHILEINALMQAFTFHLNVLYRQRPQQRKQPLQRTLGV